MSKPAVLFVCVKNAGKSQMAAALMRKLVGDRVDVYSAGTNPGDALNDLSVRVLAEVGAPVDGEHPKPIDPRLLEHVNVVVTLGSEAHLDTAATPSQTWITDEPSTRGIDGIERMRLIRDDIAARVQTLAAQLLTTTEIP
ncbi:low molecular weight phosphatase family protein [Mycobacterium sp. NBC_00419]|uniref:arsenate-mycothiol transferase ArsC n=1 Tax=Mycobacterium sp. NBC_00419 TaxID=2975989 RepID=UPI002E1D34BC